jgi:DMSO/TMAO reductase YedYZ molybdopterin-dependent catalytic subunit
MNTETRGVDANNDEKRVREARSRGGFRERPLGLIEVAPATLHRRSRRDFLCFGAGVIGALAIGYSQLPRATLQRWRLAGKGPQENDWLLKKAMRFDDEVAETLYSPKHLVPTYTRSEVTPLKNNYNGVTPAPGYIPRWHLTVAGLSSGLPVCLNIYTLVTRHQICDQITRLVCVEGWSAVVWWSGLKFDDLCRAYPPVSQARWAYLESSVNLDGYGKADPYFVSIDLATARHPQTLLATHLNGQPLTVEHGAPLRLVAPVKLGLKNIKAITNITYSKAEPRLLGRARLFAVRRYLRGADCSHRRRPG